jgi:hypothetical protein
VLELLGSTPAAHHGGARSSARQPDAPEKEIEMKETFEIDPENAERSDLDDPADETDDDEIDDDCDD